MRVLLLAVSITLLALQAMIVVIGLFRPEVSRQYQAFFIDHTITDWLRETPMPDRPAS